MTSGSLTQAQLEQLSDAELMAYEDSLFLRYELNPRLPTRWSAGRAWILLLSFFYMALTVIPLSLLSSYLQKSNRGILLIPVMLLMLGAAVWFAYRTWGLVGPRIRRTARTALHYWPLTLYIAGAVLGAWVKLQRS